MADNDAAKARAKLDKDRKRRSRERDRSRKRSVAARKKRERERKKQIRESNKKAAKKRKDRAAKVSSAGKVAKKVAGGVRSKQGVASAGRKLSHANKVNKVAHSIRAKNPSMSEAKSRRLARQVVRAQDQEKINNSAIAKFAQAFNSASRGDTIEGAAKKFAKVSIAKLLDEQDAKNSDFESRYSMAASGDQKWVKTSGFGDSAAESKAKFMLFNKMHSDISHNVRPEDRLSAIAKAHGTTDFQTAWDQTMESIDPQLLQDTIDRVQYAMDHGEDPSEAAMLEMATAYSSSAWNGME